MRRVSKKRAAIERRWKPQRMAYLAEFPQCVICWQRPASCVHEIACGMSLRVQSFQEPACWLATCGPCNCGPLTDYALWPIERQLAVKWIVDVGRFDVEKFNIARGRAPEAITIYDLIPTICRELDRGRNG